MLWDSMHRRRQRRQGAASALAAMAIGTRLCSGCLCVLRESIGLPVGLAEPLLDHGRSGELPALYQNSITIKGPIGAMESPQRRAHAASELATHVLVLWHRPSPPPDTLHTSLQQFLN